MLQINPFTFKMRITMGSKETEDVIIAYFTFNDTVCQCKSVCHDCNEKRYETHVIDEN